MREINARVVLTHNRADLDNNRQSQRSYNCLSPHPTSFVNFRRKMEFDLRIIRPFRIQEPLALRQVYQIPILVLRNISMLESDKVFQFFSIPARDPAGFVER